MKNISNDIKGIASLTLFSEMRKANVDILDVIGIMAINSVKAHYSRRFTIDEINSWIKSEYGFKLPISVLQGAIQKSKAFNKEKKYYSLTEQALNDSESAHTESLQQHKSQAEDMLAELISFAESYSGTKFSEENKKELKNSLFNFLIESHYVDNYSPLVAKFFISKANDNNFKNLLNSIAEGLIIFLGLSNNALKGERGEDSISGTLTLVLDTEILYHLMGYHSSIYKDLAEEFYQTISEYNSLHYKNRGKNAIRLCYLPETTAEINEKFSKAEKIKRGGVKLAYHTTALQYMLETNKDVPDVAYACDKFWRELRALGITEYSEVIRESGDQVIKIPESVELSTVDSDTETYADEETIDDFQYNILSISDLDDVSPEKAAAVYSHLTRLNKINAMRRGLHSTRELEKCGVILVTGTSVVLAKSKEVYLDKTLNFGYRLADTMQSITCKIWLKLNKGLEANLNLLNLDLIIKSKLILASRKETIIRRKFDQLKQEYKDGLVSREEVTRQIVVMRNFSTLPDDIQSIDDGYLTEDEYEVKAALALKEQQDAKKTLARQDKWIDKVAEKMRLEEQEELDKKYNNDVEDWEKDRNKFVDGIKNRYYWRITGWIMAILLIFFSICLSARSNQNGLSVFLFLILTGLVGWGLRLKNDNGLKECIRFCNREHRESVLNQAEADYLLQHPKPQKMYITKDQILDRFHEDVE